MVESKAVDVSLISAGDVEELSTDVEMISSTVESAIEVGKS